MLSRRPGERLVIRDAQGNTIVTVAITEVVSGKKVRLAVEAPPEIQILREELLGKEVPGNAA
jgi:carbon storage regulator CsrA